jgi:hypothetical protein
MMLALNLGRTLGSPVALAAHEMSRALGSTTMILSSHIGSIAV